ncbi:hypothetical protein HYX10_00425 [Candidatus Woesearchaeota archaeon]|nr:hypothetical protein [Candidatus Woesearchaeota archaeon]
MQLFRQIRRRPKASRAQYKPFSSKLRLQDEFGLQKLTHTFRQKIKKALAISYEFTPEEIAPELDKKKFPAALKNRILKMLDLFERMQYIGVELSPKDEKAALKELNLLCYELDRKANAGKYVPKPKNALIEENYEYLNEEIRHLPKLKKEQQALREKKLAEEQGMLEEEKRRQLEIKERVKLEEEKWKQQQEMAERKKLLRQLRLWKSRGYDTALLEAEIQGSMSRKTFEVNRMLDVIRSWKAKGYDTDKLEKDRQKLEKQIKAAR